MKVDPLLHDPPATEREEKLLEALRDAERRDIYQQGQLAGMNSMLVMHGVYHDRTSSQLGTQEEKKKKKPTGKLMMDGNPRLVTGDRFYENAVDHDHEQDRLAAAKEQRKLTREERAEAMKEWKVKDDERKRLNAETTRVWKEAIALWEIERDEAKAEKRKRRWNQPKRGKLLPAIPRPKATIDVLETVDDAPETDGGGDDVEQSSSDESDSDQ